MSARRSICTDYSAAARNPGGSLLCNPCTYQCRTFAKILVPGCPAHGVFRSRTHSLGSSLSVFSRGHRDENRGVWALRNIHSSTQPIAHGIIQGFKFWQVHFPSFQPITLAGLCSRFTTTRPVTRYQADYARFNVRRDMCAPTALSPSGSINWGNLLTMADAKS